MFIVAEIDIKGELIYGYKGFHTGLVNQFGEKYEIGKVYTDPNIDMNMGYHFCKNIEDVFLFSEYRKDTEIYQVCGSGKMISYSNDYYGLYDVYATEKLKIVRKVCREEFIQYFLTLSDFYYLDRVLNFISRFKLNKEEIQLFKERFIKNSRVLDYIAYYQEGDTKIFERHFQKK